MSFSTEIKTEICMLKNTRPEYISELCAFVRNNRKEDNDVISLMTENPKVARRIFTLFRDIYEINTTIEQKKGVNFSKKNFYYLKVSEKVKEITDDLMLNLDIPKDYMVDSDDLKISYLRGAFLAAGSLNDPKKSRYHLEFLIEKLEEAKFISKLLTYFSINNKIINRDYGFMVYVKEADKIGDFLRLINATRAVLYYEDIRIYRDHKNMTNRLNNCEQANVDKMIKSSSSQIEDIDRIIELIGLNAAPEKLRDVMIYRKKYPEVSLQELSYIISTETNNPITKSGLNHRIRKIKELRQKLEGFNKKNTD